MLRYSLYIFKKQLEQIKSYSNDFELKEKTINMKTITTKIYFIYSINWSTPLNLMLYKGYTENDLLFFRHN